MSKLIKGNKKIITAQKGKIISEEGSKYMTLVLYDGFYHEEYSPKRRNVNNMNNMPASNATFALNSGVNFRRVCLVISFSQIK